MVEKQADAMLRRLDWDTMHNTSVSRDMETPSVLKEVDAMTREPNATEIPVASLDEILVADSDASLQLSSDNQPLAKTLSKPVVDEVIEVSDNSDDTTVPESLTSETSDNIPIADLEKNEDSNVPASMPTNKEDSDKVSITESQNNEKSNDGPDAELTDSEDSDNVPIAALRSSDSSSDELLGDILSQSVLLAWEKHREATKNAESSKVNSTPINPVSPDHISSVESESPPQSMKLESPIKEVSPMQNALPVKSVSSVQIPSPVANVSPMKSVSSAQISSPMKSVSPVANISPVKKVSSMMNVSPVKSGALNEVKSHPPVKNGMINTLLGTSGIKEDSLSTSSSSLIPVVTSSFSALEASGHSPLVEETQAFKPSPLTRDDIDRLFPRISTPQQRKDSTPDSKLNQGIVCPLCLAL